MDVERERLEKALEEGLREPFLLQMLLLSFSLRRPNHTTCEGRNLMHPQGRPSFDRGDAVLDRLLHLLERAHLDLAHALA